MVALRRSPMLVDSDLVPFTPPAQPLGLSGIPAFLRNYIETWPRSAYEQETTRVTTWWVDALLVCAPDLIHEMLVERADTFGRAAMTRRALAPVIGETSILLVEGADWRWQRRAVAPIFRHETLLSFVPVFAAMAARQVERWRKAPRDVPVEVGADMTSTTFDVIVETMLGGSAALDVERCGRALTVHFETIPWHMLLTTFSAPAWLPFPGRLRATKARDFLHENMQRIIAGRRATSAARRDLLDLLLAVSDTETGRRMSDSDLVNNLLTFIAAGHETTAVALTWTLWLLAKDEAVQQRLVEEVSAVMGSGAIEAAHIEELAFHRQVIEEAMRLYPPVPALARQAKAETTLGEHHVKSSTQIAIPIFALHRHVRLWENPNAFDPDRFAPDQVKARPRYAHLPFGAGPRVCIGASFAMIEAVTILAALVRAFRFQRVPGHKPKPIARVSLRPQGGMPLLIEPR
jgi:cytochrome P450